MIIAMFSGGLGAAGRLLTLGFGSPTFGTTLDTEQAGVFGEDATASGKDEGTRPTSRDDDTTQTGGRG